MSGTNAGVNHLILSEAKDLLRSSGSFAEEVPRYARDEEIVLRLDYPLTAYRLPLTAYRFLPRRAEASRNAVDR